MFVEDLKSNYIGYGLPKKFIDCIPEYCESCGSPLEIGESLTGLHCSNPRCVDKIAKRIEMICQDLDIMYFGESAIRKFIDYYGITNPLAIFALEEGMDLSDDVSPIVSEKVINQILSKKDFLLWEYVMCANLPYLKTNARKIFQGYSSLEEAYMDIEDGGVEFIQNSLGIYNEGEVSIQAIKIYNTLMEYKEDLFDCIPNVNIVDLDGVKEINVVCSDEVGTPFKKKSEFYAYIKNEFKDKVHVNFLSSVSKSIDYLVWKGADGSPAWYTSKVKSVESWNGSGKTDIPILTAKQLIHVLEEM